jgi:alkylation response protein AidB-like acyl-CoA dehydrogenase
MDFTLTEEQQLIRETAKKIFRNECGLDFIREAWGDQKLASSLWEKHLCEWVELADGDVVDVALFLEECGKAVAPGVFFPTLLARMMASAAGMQLSGSATVAVAGEDGIWEPNGKSVKHYVPCAAQAENIVVVHGSPSAPELSVVPANESIITEVDNMDRLRPLYQVDISGANLSGTAMDADAWQRAVCCALVAASAELVGVGRWLQEAAVEYAKQREQFGKPVGAFQGLQWKMVDASLELERAAAAVSYAAMCLDAGGADAENASLIAKAEAGRAARLCARMSMQVHAGIGYTWEHGLHYWLRRAYAGDAFMGGSE